MKQTPEEHEANVLMFRIGQAVTNEDRPELALNTESGKCLSHLKAEALRPLEDFRRAGMSPEQAASAKQLHAHLMLHMGSYITRLLEEYNRTLAGVIVCSMHGAAAPANFCQNAVDMMDALEKVRGRVHALMEEHVRQDALLVPVETKNEEG